MAGYRGVTPRLPPGEERDDGGLQGLTAGGAEEGGVSEGEDAAVGGREPVAPAGRRRGHAHDRLVQGDGARRAVEAGVAEGEDAAVRRREPVAPSGGSGGHGHD